MVTKSLKWGLAKGRMRDRGNVLTPPHPTPKPKQDNGGSGGRQAALVLSLRDSGLAPVGPQDSDSAAQGPAHFMMGSQDGRGKRPLNL